MCLRPRGGVVTFQRYVSERKRVLHAIIGLQNADFGMVQLYHREKRPLELVAQDGFAPEFRGPFRYVGEDSNAGCGRALRAKRRVVIEDVDTDPGSQPYREAAASAGYRALQIGAAVQPQRRGLRRRLDTFPPAAR